MDRLQQEIVNNCKLDFLKMSSHKPDISQKALLVSHITQLLGIYGLGYSKELHHLLRDMIAYGERNNLVLAGQRYEFDALNRRYKVPVDEKPVAWKIEFSE